MDKLVYLPTSDDFNQNTTFIYDEYLPLTKVYKGLNVGKYYQGKYQASRENYLEGYVHITLKGEVLIVFIQGIENVNRAVNDDIVVIKLSPESQCLLKSRIVFKTLEEKTDLDSDNDTDIANITHEKNSEKRPTGKVLAIIKRNWRPYCGVLRERNPNINQLVVLNRNLFLPDEPKIPPIIIETLQLDELNNKKIIVSIDSWPRESMYPKGHYVKSLGIIGDKKTENEVILIEYDVRYHEFDKSVLNCLPKEHENWKIPNEEYDNRLDLRKECIFTVDSPDCTDINVAFHCKDIGHGFYEIGVHVADLSYFVKDHTAIDKEAASRVITVYLVDRQIDMIPNLLSSNLCSLRQNVDRLTFSVILNINKNTAQIKSRKFVKSVIRSTDALTYTEAQHLIDTPYEMNKIAQSLRCMKKLAKILKRNRMEKGALFLANACKIKFVEIESETYENIVEIEAKQVNEMNYMIKEFLILTNIMVSEKIFKDFPELALLRKHPKPHASNFEDLVKSANSRGFTINISNGKALSDSLNNANIANNEVFNLMLRMIANRCMTQAIYFCSGAIDDKEDTFKHYGLACDIYTHFTSPLRRYADLIVHRLLNHSIGYASLDSSLQDKQKIQTLCDNINHRHRMAHYANRASVNFYTYLYLKSIGKPLRENGYIISVKENVIYIFVPRLACEVPYILMPLENYKFVENDNFQIHIASNVKLTQFDNVIIELSIPAENKQSLLSKVEINLIQPSITDTQKRNKTKKSKH